PQQGIPRKRQVDVVIVQRSPPPQGAFSGATSLASFEGAASALTLPRPSRGATRRRPPRRAALRCLSAYPALPDDHLQLEHLLARFHAGCVDLPANDLATALVALSRTGVSVREGH